MQVNIMMAEQMDAGQVEENVSGDKLTRISRSRAGHASNVKRKFTDFQHAVDGNLDVEIVKGKLTSLETAVANYHDVHADCVQLALQLDKQRLPKLREDADEIEEILNRARSQCCFLVSVQLDDIAPTDSVSQNGSTGSESTTSSARAMAAAKRASLVVKAKFLMQQQELELEQLRYKSQIGEEMLRQKAEMENLKIKAELEAVTAEEQTLAKFMNVPEQSAQTNPFLSTNEEFEYDTSAKEKELLDLVNQKTLFVTSTSVHKSQGGDNDKVMDSKFDPTIEEWSPPLKVNENASLALQRQMLDVMNLPKSSIITFDGDPMDYWVFIRSFDCCVGNSSVSDGAKLNRLFEYCKDKAARVIRPCALMLPSEGYKKARNLLKERFGNDFTISQAWVKKVTDGPSLKANDGDALQDFADEVRGCMETLTAMGKCNELDSRVRMVKIVERLPFHLQSRWRTKAVKDVERTGDYPNVEGLVKFLSMAAKEANDPIFGSLATKYKDQKSIDKSCMSKRGSSFNVLAEDNPTNKLDWGEKGEIPDKRSGWAMRQCCLCEGVHRLSDCKEFQKMSSQKRMELIKRKRLCFNCMDASNHAARWCRRKSDCNIEGCTLRHSVWLHEAMQFAMERPNPQNNLPTGDMKNRDVHKVEAKSCAVGPPGKGAKVVLPIVTVNVRGKGQTDFIQTHALLDPGSNRTFCSRSLLEQMGLEGKETVLSLETLNEGKDSQALEVTLEVTGTTGKKRNRNVIQLPRVYALQSFPALSSCLATSADLRRWDNFKDLDLPQVHESKVTIIIGQDIPQALMPLEVRQGAPGEPYAMRTALGWTLNGPIMDNQPSMSSVCNFVHAASDDEVALEAQIERFWKLDTAHALAGSHPRMSINDKRVIDIWDKTLTVVDGHYQMDIPFKLYPPQLPDNRSLADKRLQSLGRRLTKDPELHSRYKAGINDLLERGYAERVPCTDKDVSARCTWYLPHHNVTNPNKPDKLRIVFDCAAEYAGTSLNKAVFQGPDMTNKLIGVLVRFRERQVAVMGDIEAMFHQVKVSPCHRNALRFLWWKDGNTDKQPEVYRMAVHLFGGVWSPSCANFALRRTAEDNADVFDGKTVTTVMENFYADDCLKAVDNEEEAVTLVKSLTKLLSLGGFRLTKWISNSRKVVESIPLDERAKGVKDLDLDRSPLPIERALGVHWNTDTDVLGIKIKPKEKSYTRRGLLSIVSSVYDPLGLVCPFVLQAKCIFQDECKADKGWDDELEPGNHRRWIKWLTELPMMEKFEIQRCKEPRDFGVPARVQLHHFCDASSTAYGAVSYVRLVNQKGIPHCTFQLGKSRLAPIKPMTIPRLELLAAVVAVRLDSMLRREMRLEIHETIFWTDSMIVLQYIKNTSKRFHTFVSNRVAIIHDGSLPSQWRHVDTASNPADDASRGLDAKQMLSCTRWKQGPDFLWRDESTWPTKQNVSSDLLNDDKEVKQVAKTCVVKAEAQGATVEKLLEKYSCWIRLKKAVAWILRFKTWLFDHRRMKTQACLTVHELRRAEQAIIGYLQRLHYGNELHALEDGGRICSKSSIYKLDPIVEDGMLKIGGRLQMAPLNDQAKHPLIVPHGHVGRLIISYFHERKAAHSGKEYVLSLVRERYWIPKARTMIGQVLRKCMDCKRLRGKACAQRMANLPTDRVTPGNPPFTDTGVDCFGPFLVKRGRSQEKRYGCLFTCMACRAIHIERIHSLDANSFINALVRFSARRGMPRRMRSDNGTNFVGGERELRESIQKWNETNRMKEYLLLNEIEWEFNTPTASHMGGVWERQIRTVRKVLNATLKDQVLDDERLDTLFCEVESIVNGRPITPVSDNPKDLEALTPNHLLLLRAGQPAPPGNFIKQDSYGRRWRHVQLLSDQFWKRWVREYLPTIQLRQKWIEPQRNLAIGDMVLIMDEATPRKNWPLGLVTETFPGKDGLVRSAEVKSSRNTLVRPITKLCLLESHD